MPREGLLSIGAKVETSASSAAAKSLVPAAPPAGRSGVGVGVAIVGGRHCCCNTRDMSSEVEFV